MWGALVAVGVCLVALVGTAIGDLLSEEMRGRLDEIPHRLLRLAARRLPATIREETLREWYGELHEILRGAQARPVTRLIRGTRYATGLFRVAPSIGRITIGQTARRLTDYWNPFAAGHSLQRRSELTFAVGVYALILTFTVGGAIRFLPIMPASTAISLIVILDAVAFSLIPLFGSLVGRVLVAYLRRRP
jgi:hypothetical protein